MRVGSECVKLSEPAELDGHAVARPLLFVVRQGRADHRGVWLSQQDAAKRRCVDVQTRHQ